MKCDQQKWLKRHFLSSFYRFKRKNTEKGLIMFLCHFSVKIIFVVASGLILYNSNHTFVLYWNRAQFKVGSCFSTVAVRATLMLNSASKIDPSKVYWSPWTCSVPGSTLMPNSAFKIRPEFIVHVGPVQHQVVSTEFTLYCACTPWQGFKSLQFSGGGSWIIVLATATATDSYPVTARMILH